MEQAETARALLSEFGRAVGLPNLAFDANGFCAVASDNVEMVLQHQPEAGELVLAVEVGQLPHGYGHDFLATLLELNHARALRRSGTVGLNRDAGTIVFVDRWPVAGLTLDGLRARVRSATSTVEGWREIVARTQRASEAPLNDAALETLIRI